MADRPIIFSAPMVRALLEGRKTQTRRQVHKLFRSDYDLTIAKDRHGRNCYAGTNPHGVHWIHDDAPFFPYAIGDRLWVREAFSYETLDVDRCGFMPPWYWADGNPESGDFTRPKPSIHMPRWASRLTLHVTDVRVQRLQEISEADAVAEGCPARTDEDLAGMEARGWFRDLWDSLHGPDTWDKNPWVAAITFDVKRGNIDTPTGGTNDRS